MKILLALCSLALVAGDVFATCPQRRGVVHQAAVVTPIITTAFVPVYVPQYSTAYDPSPDLEGIKQELQKMKQLFQNLQPAPAPFLKEKTSRGGPVDALAVYAGVIKAKCAACHHDSNAKTKGANFVLLAGPKFEPVKLSDYALWRMLVQTHTNQMPKKGEPLTDSEYSAVVDAAELLRQPADGGEDAGQVLEDPKAADPTTGLVCCPTTGNALVVRQRFVRAAVVTPAVPVVQVQALVIPPPVFLAPLVVSPAAVLQVPVHQAAVLVPQRQGVRNRFLFPARPVLRANVRAAVVVSPRAVQRQVVRTRIRK